MRLRALLFALLALAGSFLFLGGTAGAAEKKLSEASEDCIKAVEETDNIDSCQEAPNPILPATNELLWGSFAFAVLFGLSAWKGVPAVKSAMAARATKISHSLDEAETPRAEAAGVLAQYNTQL